MQTIKKDDKSIQVEDYPEDKLNNVYKDLKLMYAHQTRYTASERLRKRKDDETRLACSKL